MAGTCADVAAIWPHSSPSAKSRVSNLHPARVAVAAVRWLAQKLDLPFGICRFTHGCSSYFSSYFGAILSFILVSLGRPPADGAFSIFSIPDPEHFFLWPGRSLRRRTSEKCRRIHTPFALKEKLGHAVLSKYGVQ